MASGVRVALHAWSDVAVFPILGMDWCKYSSQGEEVLAERLAGWQEQYPNVRVQRRLVCDQPARWLLEESERAQLVVVAAAAAAGSPTCCWARSAPRSHNRRKLR